MTSSVLMEANVTAEGVDAFCGYTEECGTARFLFVMIASGIAVVGIFCNLLLAKIFFSTQCPNTPPTVFPLILAVLDCHICILYVLLFGVDVAMIYLKLETLFVIYHAFIIPAFVLTKVCQLAIPYMLIFATLERYIWISTKKRQNCLFSAKGRKISAVLCLLLCFCLRIPTFWSLKVAEFELCHDFFRSLAVAPEDWAVESRLWEFYDFQLITFVQTFLPFLILVASNFVIVRRLAIIQRANRCLQVHTVISETMRRRSWMSQIPSLRRRKMSRPVRNAVYTMLVIVSSYLVCNSLHMILTVLEKFDSDLLKTEDDPTKASIFYTVFGDTISCLYMFTSAIRIVIYCTCNPTICQHLMATLARFLPSLGVDVVRRNSRRVSVRPQSQRKRSTLTVPPEVYGVNM
uniref:G_PROTEIN_RECEP_F1_2 domain-containing protein n=1 Tax=Steinernema glaseri TaxID=37863 RepID=A0A1I7YX90_9BILA